MASCDVCGRCDRYSCTVDSRLTQKCYPYTTAVQLYLGTVVRLYPNSDTISRKLSQMEITQIWFLEMEFREHFVFSNFS
jgi:hypothetical protein